MIADQKAFYAAVKPFNALAIPLSSQSNFRSCQASFLDDFVVLLTGFEKSVGAFL